MPRCELHSHRSPSRTIIGPTRRCTSWPERLSLPRLCLGQPCSRRRLALSCPVVSRGGMWIPLTFCSIFPALCNMRVGNFGRGSQNERTSNRTYSDGCNAVSTLSHSSSAKTHYLPKVKRLESVLFTAVRGLTGVPCIFSWKRNGCSKVCHPVSCENTALRSAWRIGLGASFKTLQAGHISGLPSG